MIGSPLPTGAKATGGKKGLAPAAAGAAGVAGKLAEDSAHERDDNSESTISEDSLNRMGARQGSGSIEEIRRHQGDPQAVDEQQRYLEKGKGKMIERRRTDSASSLRYACSASSSTLLTPNTTATASVSCLHTNAVRVKQIQRDWPEQTRTECTAADTNITFT